MLAWLRKLFFLSSFLVYPLASWAAAGPAGHHHGDESAAQTDQHSGHHNNHQAEGDAEHDHSAHEWEAPEEEKKRPNPVKASAESIATGMRLYRHYCITCHGFEADGTGMHGQNLNPEPANLREMAGHHTDGDYHYKIRTGHGPMPHWGSTIRSTDIWHLVNYLQSLTPENPTSQGHGSHAHNHDKKKPASSKKPHDHSMHKH